MICRQRHKSSLDHAGDACNVEHGFRRRRWRTLSCSRALPRTRSMSGTSRLRRPTKLWSEDGCRYESAMMPFNGVLRFPALQSDLLSEYSLQSCQVIKTRTGRSRGFAIVTFFDVEQVRCLLLCLVFTKCYCRPIVPSPNSTKSNLKGGRFFYVPTSVNLLLQPFAKTRRLKQMFMLGTFPFLPLPKGAYGSVRCIFRECIN